MQELKIQDGSDQQRRFLWGCSQLFCLKPLQFFWEPISAHVLLFYNTMFLYPGNKTCQGDCMCVVGCIESQYFRDYVPAHRNLDYRHIFILISSKRLSSLWRYQDPTTSFPPIPFLTLTTSYTIFQPVWPMWKIKSKTSQMARIKTTESEPKVDRSINDKSHTLRLHSTKGSDIPHLRQGLPQGLREKPKPAKNIQDQQDKTQETSHNTAY